MTGPCLDRTAIMLAFDALAGDGPLGLAVSGGGDSMALLALAKDWAEGRQTRLSVATVEHGLRPESEAEARQVAQWVAALGLPHTILPWRDHPKTGNLPAAARDARVRLLATWAKDTGLTAVALGHTRDDQAETVLMRLARGSGVDGLAGMVDQVHRHGVPFIRPLLTARRADLRTFLQSEGLRWIDDPTNDDPRYDRVKTRALLADPPLPGLSTDRLARTAEHMALARESLDWAAARLAEDALRTGSFGEAHLALAPLRDAPREAVLRLVSDALRRTAGAVYRPRFQMLASLMEAAFAGEIGGGRALHGCLIRQTPHGLLVLREPSAVAPRQPIETPEPWDSRWRLTAAPTIAGAEIGPIGEAGLAQLRAPTAPPPPPTWRAAPMETRRAAPAIWRGDRLLAAPHAGFGLAAAFAFQPPSTGSGHNWSQSASPLNSL